MRFKYVPCECDQDMFRFAPHETGPYSGRSPPTKRVHMRQRTKARHILAQKDQAEPQQ